MCRPLQGCNWAAIVVRRVVLELSSAGSLIFRRRLSWWHTDTGPIPEQNPCPPCVVAASVAAGNGGSVLGSATGSGSSAAGLMHGIRCGPTPVSALSPCSSELVGALQSLVVAVGLTPAMQSPLPWFPPRDPLSERERRLLPVPFGDEHAKHRAVFSLEVLPSVPVAAALHRRHCFFKVW